MNWWTKYVDMTGCIRTVKNDQFTTALFVLTDLHDHGYNIISTNVQKFGGGCILK